MAGQVPKLSTQDCAVDSAYAHRRLTKAVVVPVYDAPPGSASRKIDAMT